MDTQSEPSSGIRAANLPTLEQRNKAKELKAEIRAALKSLPIKLTPTGIEFTDNSLKGIKAEDLRNLTKKISELRELLNPKAIPNSIKPLEKYLKETTSDGKPLETLFDAGSLEAEIEQSLNAFKDGPLGFTPDLTKLSFPTDSNTLEQLKSGLESGALTGAILTAFPSEVDLPKLVTALNIQESKRVTEAALAKESYEQKTFTIESLKDMSVTEFLARHFEARGGIFFSRNGRIATWNNLRWQPNDSLFSAGFTSFSAVYASAPFCETAFNYLKPQATLGEVLSTAALTFSFTRKEIPDNTKLIQGANPKSTRFIDSQGCISFERLMKARTEILSPIEWLSLLSRSVNPEDYNTYPTPNCLDKFDNWEWLGAITSASAAGAYSGSLGAVLVWSGPRNTGGDNRARSAFRGAIPSS